MGLFDRFGRELRAAKQKRAAEINGRHLKDILKRSAQERDKIEGETGRRPGIDETTRMFMQKVLNVWIGEGRDIDEEKFWREVDHNRQFDHPVEYYEIGR